VFLYAPACLAACLPACVCLCVNRGDKARLGAEAEMLRQRQEESEVNEDQLNEKLKAITEKCQAVLFHNSKLQEQVCVCVCVCVCERARRERARARAS
jgi:hypothetical protein